MNRRHFLQLSGATATLSAIPNFAFAKSVVKGVPLQIPSELQDNPLLTFGQLPNYPAIAPEHIEVAVQFINEWGKQAIESLCEQKNPSWDSFYRPLEDIHAKLNYTMSIARNINSVNNTKEFRKAYDAARKHRSAFSNWYDTNPKVYELLKALQKSPAHKRYSQIQKVALKKDLWEFEKSGVGLPDDKKEKLTELSNQLSDARAKFTNNIQDANKWSKLIVDVKELSGIPQADISAAADAAKKAGKEGYLFTLNDAFYWTILDNADNRELRETFFKQGVTRASDQGDNAGKYDNMPIIKEILSLRHQTAQLLGYKNYAEYALVDRMANNPKEVMDFYNGLIKKLHKKAQSQYDELVAYGKEKLGIDNPQPWDIAYIENKYRADLYSLDEETLRAYFPIDKVLSGMFEINRRLFGIVAKERKNVPVWHESVRFFDLYDEKGKLLGSTYVDLYSREGKRGGAWKSNFIDRRRDLMGKMVTPITVLAANFTPPADGVALLSQRNVITLFHEFGHVVHQIIGDKVDVLSVTGTSGVPRDAVEFPSQLMEYWVWQQQAMPLFSGHYKTGKPLPMALIKQAAAAKDFMAAKTAIRQIELGLTDMRLYNEYDPNDPDFAERTIKEVQNAVKISPILDYARGINVFSHIFSGGYAAGYYGYLWSDVLSADAFSKFERTGIFNRKTGKAFVDKFLGKGGSDDIMTMYVDFMGAKPKPDAFMKQLGAN